MKIVLMILLLIFFYVLYKRENYEHMTNFGEYIKQNKECDLNNMLHLDVCQIQQPQLGKDRPYVNWAKIHNYYNFLY
jgi:hypothetical protein